jgi:hypothetical protein
LESDSAPVGTVVEVAMSFADDGQDRRRMLGRGCYEAITNAS